MSTDLSALDYDPTPGETFSHYCDQEAFWSIIRTRSLWLTSIRSLNDPGEPTWGRDKLVEILRDNKHLFPRHYRWTFLYLLFAPMEVLLPLVASFSGPSDLLSQWRAYAGDGEGFSIQFSAIETREELPVNLNRVEYRPEVQESIILDMLKAGLPYWRDNPVAATIAMQEVVTYMAFDLHLLKHPGYSEEQEVRMLHIIQRDGDWWTDVGGNTAHGSFPPMPVKKRTVYDKDTPYIELSLPGNVIKSVTLGPKNPQSIAEVKRELGAYGLNPEVQKSSLPYR